MHFFLPLWTNAFKKCCLRLNKWYWLSEQCHDYFDEKYLIFTQWYSSTLFSVILFLMMFRNPLVQQILFYMHSSYWIMLLNDLMDSFMWYFQMRCNPSSLILIFRQLYNGWTMNKYFCKPMKLKLTLHHQNYIK